MLLSLQTVLLLAGFADEWWSAGGNRNISVQVGDRWKLETKFLNSLPLG